MNGAILAAVAVCCATAFAQIPSDAEIRKILAERVGGENLGIGMVAGVIDANGRRVVAYGSLAKNDSRRLGGDTVFEIGSMTKVFTSLVLMDMARRGEVALTDPVAKYLPNTVKVSPAFADLTRQQLPQLKGMMGQFGALQSVTFKGVGPGGADIYEVAFEHAKMEFRITLSADGKTQGIGIRPM